MTRYSSGGIAMKASICILFSVLILGAAAPARAHHAFAAEFDAKNCADVTGVLTKVAYENPHAYLFMDVKGGNGQTEQATFQLSSTSNLRRGGATPAVLNASLNKEVLIRGCGSRNGEKNRYSGWDRMSKASSAPRSGGDHEQPDRTDAHRRGARRRASLRADRGQRRTKQDLRRGSRQRQAGAAAARRRCAPHG
jgi:hypothetical protein